MVKGYSGSYVKSYMMASSPTFAVGEYWDSSVSKVLLWPIALLVHVLCTAGVVASVCVSFLCGLCFGVCF